MYYKQLFFTLLISAALAACASTSREWEYTRKINTSHSYTSFIAKYPNSKFNEEAKMRLYEAEWAETKGRDTINAYSEFIDKYPTSKNEEIVELLLSTEEGVETEKRFCQLYAELFSDVVKGGKLQIVELLIDKTTTFDFKCGSTHGHYIFGGGRSLLSLAVKSNNSNIARLMIEKGADINYGFPLHAAALANNTDIAKELISRGINIEAEDEDGDRPLHIAASMGNTDMVELLLAHGAKFNAPTRTESSLIVTNDGVKGSSTSGGETALHLAAKRGRLEAVKLLIESGANSRSRLPAGSVLIVSVREIRDSSGYTPLDVANAMKQIEVAEYLKSYAR